MGRREGPGAHPLPLTDSPIPDRAPGPAQVCKLVFDSGSLVQIIDMNVDCIVLNTTLRGAREEERRRAVEADHLLQHPMNDTFCEHMDPKTASQSSRAKAQYDRQGMFVSQRKYRRPVNERQDQTYANAMTTIVQRQDIVAEEVWRADGGGWGWGAPPGACSAGATPDLTRRGAPPPRMRRGGRRPRSRERRQWKRWATEEEEALRGGAGKDGRDGCTTAPQPTPTDRGSASPLPRHFARREQGTVRGWRAD